MVQINEGNVLLVRNELRFQLEQMQSVLATANQTRGGTALGQDLVSREAAEIFGAKTDEIVGVHHAHMAELAEAADRLSGAARDYGYTDADMEDSFRAARGGLEARLADIRSTPPLPARPAGS